VVGGVFPLDGRVAACDLGAIGGTDVGEVRAQNAGVRPDVGGERPAVDPDVESAVLLVEGNRGPGMGRNGQDRSDA
jgi:hypothetical protein